MVGLVRSLLKGNRNGPAAVRRLYPSRSRYGRQPRFEVLEDRHMLAVLTVNTASDVTLAGDGLVTLREAVIAANMDLATDLGDVGSGADTIEFAAGLTEPIELSQIADTTFGASALVVSSPLAIQGNATGITISRNAAGPEMRLFRVTTVGELTLQQVMLTGGVIEGATGEQGRGGAILVQSGATLDVLDSTLAGHTARGGSGQPGRGGAIFNDGGDVTIYNSTLSGNAVRNHDGGVASQNFGAGIYSLNGMLAIYHSTITDNTANAGRGVYAFSDGAGAVGELQIYHTIVAQAGESGITDIVALEDNGGTQHVTGNYNLYREALNSVINNTGAILGDPLLDTLTDNGGPTWTHALLDGSPAIDAGDPTAVAGENGVPDFDQRGAPDGRVYSEGGGDQILDIGAFELQPDGATGPPLPGDYNGDWTVNAADYTVWRNTLWTAVARYSGADGNGSSVIDMDDYQVWKDHYGETMTMGTGATTEPLPPTAAVAASADAGFEAPAVDQTPGAASNRAAPQSLSQNRPGEGDVAPGQLVLFRNNGVRRTAESQPARAGAFPVRFGRDLSTRAHAGDMELLQGALLASTSRYEEDAGGLRTSCGINEAPADESTPAADSPSELATADWWNDLWATWPPSGLG